MLCTCLPPFERESERSTVSGDFGELEKGRVCTEEEHFCAPTEWLKASRVYFYLAGWRGPFAQVDSGNSYFFRSGSSDNDLFDLAKEL